MVVMMMTMKRTKLVRDAVGARGRVKEEEKESESEERTRGKRGRKRIRGS